MSSPSSSSRFRPLEPAPPTGVTLAVCDPPEQSIGELADALLASRSAITGAVKILETSHVVRRTRAAGERMDRVRIDLSSPQSLGMDVTEYPAHWLGAIGLLLLFTLALIWLATALGLAAKSVETAGNTPMFLTLLPFLGSGFVPAATMPPGLEQFAEAQPFTPVTETVRGLLTGTAIGTQAIGAVAWCVGIAVASYLWALHLYARRQPS